MCVVVLGQRRCSMCDLILLDSVKLPLDKRYRECSTKDPKHNKVVHINYIPMVCACCKESSRVSVLRAKMVVGAKVKTLNPEAKEFVPEHMVMGKKVAWIGGWWVEQ